MRPNLTQNSPKTSQKDPKLTKTSQKEVKRPTTSQNDAKRDLN